ncbi:myosin regulatory light chain 2, smooth muscle minor isoform [Sergentomyia squamirostris]
MGDEDVKKKKKKTSRKASKVDDALETPKDAGESTEEPPPPAQDEIVHKEEESGDVDGVDKDSNAEDGGEKKSTAATLLEAILNESTMSLPDENQPYEVPIAVKAGDINALRDLDERKLIELKEAFSLFDLNGDGFIDAEDLKSTYGTLGQEISDEQVSAMLSEAINPLDFDAYVVLMGYKTIELDPEEVLLEALSKWDKMRTGFIDKDCVKHDLMNFGDKFSLDEVESALLEAPIAKGTGPGFNCHGPPMIDYPAFCKIIGGFRKRMKKHATENII